ncbi:MAG: flippase-like domain-containing protein [Fibrobacteria bacterium]|nr:flippase-like domain-containing protein [Fibrobacteria bacterium]
MAKSNKLIHVSRFLFAAALAWLVLANVKFTDAVALLSGASVPLLALSLAGNLLALHIQAIRWKLLLGGHGPSTWRLFLWNLVGGAASFLLPSSASGDVVKSLLMGRQENLLGKAVVTTALGRYLGLVATLGMCFSGFLLWPQVRSILSLDKMLLLLVAFILLGVGGVWVLRTIRPRIKISDSPGKWERRLHSALQVADEAMSRPKMVLQALLLSILLQLANLLAGWCLFLAIGSDVSLVAVLALLPIVQMGTLAPISLGGIGVREGITLALFHGLAGVSQPQCLAANLAGYLVTAILALIGLVSWLMLRRRTTPPSAAEGEA